MNIIKFVRKKFKNIFWFQLENPKLCVGKTKQTLVIR